METRERFKYLYGPFVKKAFDDESGQALLRYVFTSENMDEGGDIITQDATVAATERWKQWRNIRFQHNPDRPIGKAVRIGKSDGLEWNEMDVRIDDPDILPLVSGDDPVLGGASVGIIVNDYKINEDDEAQERAFWEPWIITDYDLVEISLVDHPMNYDAKRVGEVTAGRGRMLFRRRDIDPRMKGPSGNAGLPLGDRDREWDSTAARDRVRAWAGGSDKDDINWEKYRQAFFWYDEEDAENFGSYKLPFADVVSGELTAIPRGVFAAAQRLDMTGMPEEDRTGVRSKIGRYYSRMREEFDDDSLVPPWDKEEKRDMPEDMENLEELDKALEPEVAKELDKEPSDIPEEGGDPDPALVALAEIKAMLTNVSSQIGDIHKAFMDADEEEDLDEEAPDEGEEAPEETEPEEGEDLEGDDTDMEEEQAEPDALTELGKMVTQIYEHLFGDKAEDAEVASEDQPDLDKIVEQKVNEVLEKKSKLQPRKSAALEPEGEEHTKQDEQKSINPRERLRMQIGRAFRTEQEE